MEDSPVKWAKEIIVTEQNLKFWQSETFYIQHLVWFTFLLPFIFPNFFGRLSLSFAWGICEDNIAVFLYK